MFFSFNINNSPLHYNKKTALKRLFECDLFTSASTYGKLFPAAR